MLLVSQLAFHPMFKISTNHQHTSFYPNSRSRHSLNLRTVRDMVTPSVRLDIHSKRALGHPLLSSLVQLVVRLSNTNVFRLLPGNSLITLSGPYPIIRYKISVNALTSSTYCRARYSSHVRTCSLLSSPGSPTCRSRPASSHPVTSAPRYCRC